MLVAKYKGERLWLEIVAFMATRLIEPRGYILALEEWMEFLQQRVGTPEGARAFLSADYLKAVAYLRELGGRPGQPARRQEEAQDWKLSSNTIAFKLTVLRRLYKLVLNHGMIAVNPFAEVRQPKRNEAMKRPTEPVELDLVPTVIDANLTLADRTISALMFGSAIRPNNVRLLKLSDCRLGSAEPAVFLRRTKARTQKLKRISDEAAELLAQQVRVREIMGAGPEDWVFVSNHGENAGWAPISASTVYRHFKQACQTAGANPYATPHSARKSAAMKMDQEGVPILQIRDVLDHSSVTTTEIYLARDVQGPGVKALKWRK